MFAPAWQTEEQPEGPAAGRLVGLAEQRRPARRRIGGRGPGRRPACCGLTRGRSREGRAKVRGLQSTQTHDLHVFWRAVGQGFTQGDMTTDQRVTPGDQRIVVGRGTARKRIRIGQGFTQSHLRGRFTARRRGCRHDRRILRDCLKRKKGGEGECAEHGLSGIV